MSTDHIRPPAVAGMFYPGDADELARMVDGMLVAPSDPPAFISKAIIVPHAGYIYSGTAAGHAYALLNPAQIRRVVLLGPAHRVPVRGLALPAAEAFATPLGTLPIDKKAADKALILPQVSISDAAHAPEHSLEVQLPFLQRALDEISIVPFVVGEATPDEVAQVLNTLWDGDETLIVISSDLSHFLPYEEARQMDRETVETILDATMPLRHGQACGATPINGLLHLSRRRALQAQLLDMCNSGDSSGDRSRVVGYASLVFGECHE